MAGPFIVTAKAQRPRRMNGTCFYCDQAIGLPHKPNCVLISKKVEITVKVGGAEYGHTPIQFNYEVSVPADWEKGMIEFHRNDGSWCASNMIGELLELEFNDDIVDGLETLREKAGCLCHVAVFEMVPDTFSEPYLDER